jgi:hypothetical protein
LRKPLHVICYHENQGIWQLAYFQSGGWGSCWTSSATPSCSASCRSHRPTTTTRRTRPRQISGRRRRRPPPLDTETSRPDPAAAARRPCERCAWARWSRATASASSATSHTPSKGIDAVVPMPFFFIQRTPASLLEPELLVRRDVDPNPPREKHEPREAARHGECRGRAVSVEHGGEAEPKERRCRNARALQPD